ncbi:uncharacterized protein FA14DRAFT_161092 [Meira miltonrushii]|uniref:Uncharacterized protein n=1 Tax=Meira miltonrushii TaxID=1280837 RepID=A0A316VFD1_9BASI|nr:uncharacterized protein FA14DRAFT_161092 [Meira miltonrushii]PWN36339.1 hypothetical protein FA14DRAFT_161092 [Meira miltonrushii]
MHFSIPLLISAVLTLSQYANAEGLVGMKVPASITPGHEFNVTYSWTDGLSYNQDYLAIFGFTSNVERIKGKYSIGSQALATADLSKANYDNKFNVTIRAPNHKWFKIYADVNNGTLPQPWYVSSANMQQTGSSGGVRLEVFHAKTTVKYDHH